MNEVNEIFQPILNNICPPIEENQLKSRKQLIRELWDLYYSPKLSEVHNAILKYTDETSGLIEKQQALETINSAVQVLSMMYNVIMVDQ